MKKLIFEVWNNIPSQRKPQLALVLLLMLMGAGAEMFTLGAVVPFLVLLMDDKVLQNTPLLASVLVPTSEQLGTSPLVVASLIFATLATLAGALRVML